MKSFKPLLLLGLLIPLFSTGLLAQRFAYVDTEYILNQIPEYQEAQKEIDRLSDEWRKEINAKQVEIEKMYRDFQNEQFLLTDEQKQQKIQDMESKEEELRTFQQSKFGYEGELFQKREELIKPIQDEIFNAIEKLARDRNYDFIFDKASGTTILFADPDNDKSDDILKNMGITQR